ncbi:hypothetical protein [Streptomyces swartbergensis]|uniref:Uncharacterized protein n=1 Tax=Streptomyces swartbergensis TaxID=487165 RepID=A0A243S8N4_9ACTN|nr:hypothetical protein [Streptomyces swartbergensis]OUD04021.1 hypothetical protein CA983_06300 [Streptomyces swartbergensis]
MKSWLRLLGCELRRTLPRLLPVAILLLLTVGITLQALNVQRVAHNNLQHVRLGLTKLTPESCAKDAANLPPDVPAAAFLKDCLAGLEGTRAAYENIEAGFVASAEQMGMAQHPLGAVGWTFGWFATAPGLLSVLVLAAFFTAGEWSRGTAVPLLLQEQRLWRLLSAKAAVLWVWSLLAAAATSAGVWLLAVTHTRRAFPLHRMAAADEVSAYTLQRAGTGLLVLGVACVAAVGLAAVVRMPLRTVLIGVLVLALATLPVTTWLPGPVLADGMGLSRGLNVYDHLWTSAVDSTAPAAVRALPWMALLCLALWQAWRTRPRDLV